MTGAHLIPEWVKQEAIILAWPHEHSDWAPWIDQARQTYCQLITCINNNDTAVLLLVHADNIPDTQALLAKLDIKTPRTLIVSAEYNDTWTRDYAFLTCQTSTGNQPVEFVFNGWGQKFDANKDNQINKRVLADLCRLPIRSYELIAEGGALETNENGHLLSTSSCLYNPKRNGDIDYQTYQMMFRKSLNATTLTVLKHGELEGDDTDGHIDTLVRFTPNQGLVIQSAYNRPQDSHYKSLNALITECREAFPQHAIFELPLPSVFNEDNERLPASYANFLINNGQILCPTYQQPEDNEALSVIQQAFPTHEIVAIDCLAIVQQFGSLHCITMQVPMGTLKPNIVAQMNQGISCLA
jgi:agmatine/peptidylarginine deiminase